MLVFFLFISLIFFRHEGMSFRREGVVWDGTFWAGSEFVPEVFPFSSAARLCRPLGPRPEYTLWLRPEYTLWRTVQVQLAPGRLVSYLFRLFEGKRQCEQRVGGELESWKRLNGETVGELL